MGKRRTRTEQTNTPVFGSQITGAANNITDAYNRSMPAISSVSNNMAEASGDLFSQFRQGDPTILAAQATARDLMQGGENPHLQGMIDRTNSSVRNQLQARLSRTGNVGGSDYADIITSALADNEGNLRFNDFNAAQSRRLQAAGMAPGLLQGSLMPLQVGAQLGQAGAMLPLQAAAVQGAGVGGLLSPYQTVRGTQTQSGGLLGSILSGALQGGLGRIF